MELEWSTRHCQDMSTLAIRRFNNVLYCIVLCCFVFNCFVSHCTPKIVSYQISNFETTRESLNIVSILHYFDFFRKSWVFLLMVKLVSRCAALGVLCQVTVRLFSLRVRIILMMHYSVSLTQAPHVTWYQIKIVCRKIWQVQTIISKFWKAL